MHTGEKTQKKTKTKKTSHLFTCLYDHKNNKPILHEEQGIFTEEYFMAVNINWRGETSINHNHR